MNPPGSTMGMKRSCRLCGKPVSIRRQMSLFCDSRCEALYAALREGRETPPSLPAERMGDPSPPAAAGEAPSPRKSR